MNARCNVGQASRLSHSLSELPPERNIVFKKLETGWKPVLLWLALLLAPLSAHAASYAINWSTIDGGGGATSTGGVYTVTGTIGQPDLGQASAGNYTLEGGFWSLIAVGQTPGAPLLSLTRSGGNALISWATNNAAGFVLEVTGNLVTPISWSNAPQSPVQSNGTNTVTVPMIGGPQFYRLHKP